MQGSPELAMAIQMRPERGYMRAICTGQADSGAFRKGVDHIAAATRKGAAKVLIDLRGVHQLLSVGDVAFLAEHAAIAFHHLKRVATLVGAGERKGVAEAVAIEQGLALRTFVDEPSAIAWLLSD